jgi:NAD(P)-dependent dehydrogenase (short-subunit alcohol dehydrogenase family)
MIINKVILLTGASGAIGEAIALSCININYNIVLCCNKNIHKTQLVSVAASQSGAETIVLRGDIGNKSDCLYLVDQAIHHFGKIDVLINNAGFLHQQPFLDIPEEEWDKTLDINLKAPFILSQAVFPYMIKNGGGHIVNIASSGGQLGGPLAPHYAASKAGLICLTKSLARLGAEHNIITHAISPGLIATHMSAEEMQSAAGREKLGNIPLHRPGTAAEVADMVLFAISGSMDYATGQTINLNGGLYMG